MTDYMRSFLFGVIFLGIMQAVFQTFSADESTIQTALDVIWCEYPDYVTGTTGLGACSVIEHDDGYADDEITLWNFNVTNVFFGSSEVVTWHAGIPIGWATYTGDIVASALTRFAYVFILIASILFPVGDLDTLIPVAVITLLIGFFAILYVIIGISLYKLVAPFT